jgi:hypothetical protein
MTTATPNYVQGSSSSASELSQGHGGAHQGSTSSPTDFSLGSGGGSIMAAIASKGVVVPRHTPQGSIRPFGQDIGTADDSTLIDLQAAPTTARVGP